MSCLLKINKCRRNFDKAGLNFLILECRSKFGRRPLVVDKGIANKPHVGVTKGPGDALAKSVAISSGNQHARGFIDQEVKKCIIGRRYGTAQAGLCWALRFPGSKEAGLFEKVCVEAQLCASISVLDQKLT